MAACASVLEAYSRQELPFHVFAEQLTEEDSLDPAALTQVYFVLQSAFRPLQLPEVTILPFAYPDGQRILPIDRTWLSIALKETASGIDGTCSYKPDLFGRHAFRFGFRNSSNPGQSGREPRGIAWASGQSLGRRSDILATAAEQPTECGRR